MRRDNKAVELLSIIYDGIQKIPKTNKFIVKSKDEGKMGVVDSEGNIIIPLEYTRITSSKGKLFRLYGEISYNSRTFTYRGATTKYQSIADLDGNILTPSIPFVTTISVGNYGILLGFDYIPLKNTVNYNFNGRLVKLENPTDTEEIGGLIYVGYDKSVIEFDESIESATYSPLVPDLLVLNKVERRVNDTAESDINRIERIDTFYGIRLDKGNEMHDIVDCYDKLERIKEKRETVDEYEKEYGIDTKLAKLIKEQVDLLGTELYIANIGDSKILIDRHYTPIVNINGGSIKIVYW